MSSGQSSDSYSRRNRTDSTGLPNLHRGAEIRDYVVDRFIASGGFGSVYLVQDTALNRRAALKILHPELRNLGDSFIRFLREAQVLERIRHPNIVEVYDSGTLPDGRAFVVTEFLAGMDLEEHIESSGAMSMDSTLAILEPICDALTHAHAQSVIHRDIKASNVFLSEHDGERRVVLLDFGLAKVTEQGGIDLTASRMTLGTPSCMSPEQIRGDRVDARADVYALGALCFHMLTGRPPFAGKSQTVMQYMHLHGQRPRPSSLANVSAAVDEVIAQAMAPDRKQRYESVAEFLSALRAADGVSKSNRRSRRAKQTQRAFGVYVDVRTSSEAQDSDDDDDAVLDIIDEVLDVAEERLTKAGLYVGLEGSSSTLYVRVLSAEYAQEVRERREVALAVADLRRILDDRANGALSLHVNLCLHRDTALVTDDKVTGGDLMHLTRWAPENELDGVIGSRDAFEGLDVEVEPVAGNERLVRLVIPKGGGDLLGELFTSPQSRQLLMHTQMLAQLGRQIAGIVHDLRSPLTVIQGNIDLVLQAMDEERPLSKDHRRGLEDAHAAVQQLTMTVSSILRASAIRSYGKDSRRLSVSDLITSAIRLSHSETHKKAAIQVSHDGESFIMGSPGRLTQVLVNLLVNAAQAIEHYGTITIRTQTIGDKVQIAIKDTGVGISEAMQQRIFEPFFTTKDLDQGTGLGLALVREILEEHEGSIRLDSSPDQGTCFTLELPAAPQ